MIIILGLITLFFTSCSSSTAIIPDNIPGNLSQPVTQETSGILGIFNVYVNPISGEYELTPIRALSSTDVLEVVDITNFMTLSPCTNCVKIKSVGLDAECNLLVEIGIRHPFDAGDSLKPPTGKNRADLHVFNVEGIVASSNAGISFPSIDETISSVRLLNADGYTKYLDDSLDSIYPTDATIHPYITHFDDYSEGNFSPSCPNGFQSVTDPGPSGKLVMPMGSDFDYQEYIFDVDAEPLEFVFAIGCTYALSAESVLDRFSPVYRIPQHNKKAASEISYKIIRSSLQAGVTDSDADIQIEVVDISHDVSVGEQLDQMYLDSSVESIFLEIPALMTDAVEIDGSTSIGGIGHSPDNPVLYYVTITNELGAGLGTYPGLIKVLDSYIPNTNSNPSLQQNDGIARVAPGETPLQGLFNIDEFAAYQYMEITVGEIIERPIWTTTQGDIANTGRIGYTGPQSIHNAPTWEAVYPPGWNYYGNPLPVFYNETTLFVCTTGDGGPLPCHAIDIETKTLKWSQQFHDDMQNWLNIKCLNADGTIVLTVETKYDRMIALDAETGDFMWELPGMIKVDSYPTLDLDGNFVVPLEDVGIQNIEPVSGVVNWTANIGDTYYNTPATGANGVIYTMDGGQSDCTLKALDPSDGSVNWDSETLGGHRGMGVTVHPNQSIIAWGDGGLFCFQDDGDSYTVLWQQAYTCPFYGSPAIGQDDDIYILDYSDQLRRLDPATGETITFTGDWGFGNSSRLAIGADGLIYTNTYLYFENEAYMSCFNPDCTLRWRHFAGQWFMGDGHYSSPAIGMDGSLYSCYRPWGSCGWHDDDL